MSMNETKIEKTFQQKHLYFDQINYLNVQKVFNYKNK